MNRTMPFDSPSMGHVKKIHFVGIGGVGMSGIAEVLHNEGYIISGSDQGANRNVARLRQLGVTIAIGHHADNVAGLDVVVKSTAIDENNSEIIAARQQLIPVIPRAAMLAELMRYRYGIAVAGTHGKTTTTSLVSSLLSEGGLDPSYVVGGKLNSSGANAKLGTSRYFVAEADESDASFLYLKPMMAVVTNIDADHMISYNDDFELLKNTFIEFIHHVPFYGCCVVCVDDENVKSIINKIERPIVRYGFSDHADFQAINWHQDGLTNCFTVKRKGYKNDLSIQFKLPGKHNVLNALAAIAIATQLGVTDEAIVAGLAKFEGVGRRFQILGDRQFENGRAMVIDDYGHHPKEIISTIDAFRTVWPDKRLIHVFQPHRYTRTKSLFNDFVKALSLSDHLLLMDVYSAGESKVQGADSVCLADNIMQFNNNVTLVNEGNLENELDKLIKDNDIVLAQGAGSISKIINGVVEKSREQA